PRQLFVRAGQHEVVEEKDPRREERRGAERRPVEGPGAHAAGSHREELRVTREPPDPDQDPEQERHRQRQNENPRNREEDQPSDLGKRRAAPHEELRHQEDRPHEEDERVGREAEQERRPDLADDRPGEEPHQREKPRRFDGRESREPAGKALRAGRPAAARVASLASTTSDNGSTMSDKIEYGKSRA